MITSLTKENFWNNMMEKYPVSVQEFCTWIDEYKRNVNWNMIFNSDSEYQNAQGKNATAPKYHDLPIAMQAGIFIQYLIETKSDYKLTINIHPRIFKDMGTFALLIEELFKTQHLKVVQTQ